MWAGVAVRVAVAVLVEPGRTVEVALGLGWKGAEVGVAGTEVAVLWTGVFVGPAGEATWDPCVAVAVGGTGVAVATAVAVRVAVAGTLVLAGAAVLAGVGVRVAVFAGVGVRVGVPETGVADAAAVDVAVGWDGTPET